MISLTRISLTRTAIVINPQVIDRRLQLGRWQRVFVVELDGPRDREVSVLAFGEIARRERV